MAKHSIDFNHMQWEEICSLAEQFGIGEGEALTRGQWMAVAQMALGKTIMLAEGYYDDDEDNEEWAEELREIADTILAEFKPGDGKL